MRCAFSSLVLFGLCVASATASIGKSAPEESISLVSKSLIPREIKFPSCKTVRDVCRCNAQLETPTDFSNSPKKATKKSGSRKHGRDFIPIAVRHDEHYSSHLSKRDESPAATLEAHRPHPKDVKQDSMAEITASSNPDGISMDVCGCTAVFVWTNDGHLFGAHVVDNKMAPMQQMKQEITSKPGRTVVAIKIDTPDIVENDSEAAKVELRAFTNVNPTTDDYEYNPLDPMTGGFRFTAKANVPGVSVKT